MRADGGGQSGGMCADGGGQSGGMNEDGGWQPAGRIIYGMLLFTAAGYFFTVAKTALLLGNTSNRYQLPIYGIIILLLFWTIEGMWQSLARIRHRCLPAAVAAVCLFIDLSGLHSDRVAFLYPQAGEAVALAREQAAADIPVVYVYKPGEEWCVWAVADELMEYDRVYFVSAASEDAITEPVIANADAVVSYTPRYDDLKEEEAQSMRIASGNHKLSWEYLQYLHKYCIESYHCRERRRME